MPTYTVLLTVSISSIEPVIKLEPRLITKQFYWLRKPNSLSFWDEKFVEEDLFVTIEEAKKNIIGEQKCQVQK